MSEPIFSSLLPKDELEYNKHEHWASLWNEKTCGVIEEQFRANQKSYMTIAASERVMINPGIETLYKYRAYDPQHPERSSDLLADAKLWSASLPSLNDPMEGAFRSPEDAFEAHAAMSFVYMMRSPWSGCVSFSANPVSELLWAHYAAEHTGFCIAYRRRDSFLLSDEFCQPVRYRRSMPDISVEDPTQLQELTEAVFWTKSQAWEYEHEWRLMYPRIDAYTAPGLLRPHSVIFGLKTDPEVKKRIRASAPELRFGSIVTGNDYPMRIAWDGGVSPQREDKDFEASIELNEFFEKILSLVIRVAVVSLEKSGEFFPFAVMVHDGKADIIMRETPPPDEGVVGSLMARELEDAIRARHAKGPLEMAGIIRDVYLRPLEGGPAPSAIAGRLEQSGGPSVQFTQEYVQVAGRVTLGERRLIAKSHELLP